MNYKVFQEAMKLAQAMPHEDLVLILAKPETTDRKADQTWRRTCERNGVDTSPIGVKTSDPVGYTRDYQAKQKLEEARDRIKVLEDELRKAMTQLALYKVTNR